MRCISKVGEDGGCDEDIDVEGRRIPGNKSGRRSAAISLTLRLRGRDPKHHTTASDSHFYAELSIDSTVIQQISNHEVMCHSASSERNTLYLPAHHMRQDPSTLLGHAPTFIPTTLDMAIVEGG